MAEEVPEVLVRLAEKMRSDYLDSELAIAEALAEAEEPLDVDDLVEATGYTERTVKKRTDSLEERLREAPLIRRDDDGKVSLHPLLAEALSSDET